MDEEVFVAMASRKLKFLVILVAPKAGIFRNHREHFHLKHKNLYINDR